jgi:hypothetical protein
VKFVVEVPDNVKATREELAGVLQMYDATVIAADKPAFVLIQEGGSSTEQYLHWHDTLEEAEQDRYDCRDDGSYRTSPVVEVPAIFAALAGDFEEIVQAIVDAADDIDYPDGPNPDYVEPEQPETPKDLADAGYRIELGTEGRGDDEDLIGRYWWTWSKGSAVDSSDPTWDAAESAVLDARADLARSKSKAHAAVKAKKERA